MSESQSNIEMKLIRQKALEIKELLFRMGSYWSVQVDPMCVNIKRDEWRTSTRGHPSIYDECQTGQKATDATDDQPVPTDANGYIIPNIGPYPRPDNPFSPDNTSVHAMTVVIGHKSIRYEGPSVSDVLTMKRKDEASRDCNSL